MNNLILNLIIIVAGLIIGSFINVLSFRIPKDLPIIFSRSICPKCNSLIPLYRNIPIISYILQNAKCHHCNKSISLQYPIVELSTTIIFYSGLTNGWELDQYILFLWISSILLTISIIDLRTLTIPLSLIIFMFIGELIFLFINPELQKEMFLGFIFGLAYLGIPFLITSVIYKKQTLGYGDLFLISLIGLWLGPINVLICIFLSCILGLIIWIIKYFNQLENNKLPFGTYLSINAIFIKIIGLDDTYLNDYLEYLI